MDLTGIEDVALKLGEDVVKTLDSEANGVTEAIHTGAVAAAPFWLKAVDGIFGSTVTSSLEKLEHEELGRLMIWLHNKRVGLHVPAAKVADFEAKPLAERLAAVKAAS